MRTTLAWITLGALALPAAADVTKDDLRKLALAGLSDDVVLAFIRANSPVHRLSADDIVELKQAGLGERALAAVVGGPAPVVERRVVVAPAVDYTYWAPSYYLYASTYSSEEPWFGSFGFCASRPYRPSYTSACPPRFTRPPPGGVTPPGNGGGRPGHGWTTPPGHGATPPGHGGTPPGQGAGPTPPGHIGNPSHGGVKPPGPGHQGGRPGRR
jgi:hypothetical protein